MLPRPDHQDYSGTRQPGHASWHVNPSLEAGLVSGHWCERSRLGNSLTSMLSPSPPLSGQGINSLPGPQVPCEKD